MVVEELKEKGEAPVFDPKRPLSLSLPYPVGYLWFHACAVLYEAESSSAWQGGTTGWRRRRWKSRGDESWACGFSLSLSLLSLFPLAAVAHLQLFWAQEEKQKKKNAWWSPSLLLTHTAAKVTSAATPTSSGPSLQCLIFCCEYFVYISLYICFCQLFFTVTESCSICIVFPSLPPALSFSPSLFALLQMHGRDRLSSSSTVVALCVLLVSVNYLLIRWIRTCSFSNFYPLSHLWKYRVVSGIGLYWPCHNGH